MNSQNLYQFSLKRLVKDLKELEENPLEGISICMPNLAEPQKLYANIKILYGPFKGIVVPMRINVGNKYPVEPPEDVKVESHHPICDGYHKYIFSGGWICSDLLTNWYVWSTARGKAVPSGWTCVYTMSSLLLLLQYFFSDSSFHNVDKVDIDDLVSFDSEYNCKIKINNDTEIQEVTHTTKNPYPPFLQNKKSDLPKYIQKIQELIEQYEQSNEQTQGSSEVAYYSLGKPIQTPSKYETPTNTSSNSTEIGIKNEETMKLQDDLTDEQLASSLASTKSDRIQSNIYELLDDEDNAIIEENKVEENDLFKQLAKPNLNKNKHNSKKMAKPQGKKRNLYSFYSEIPVPDQSEQEFKFEIRNKLLCPVTKQSILDDPYIILGYPIHSTLDKFERIFPTPVIEIYSQEGINYYTSSKNQFNLYLNSLRQSYSSVYCDQFNQWLPIGINSEHFARARPFAEKVIAEISNGMVRSNVPFHPKMVIRVLTAILVKTSISILKGNLYQSESAVDAYCHYYDLFMKFIEYYPELQQEIDDQVEQFVTYPTKRHKKLAGDLGEFMIKLSLSSYGIGDEKSRIALFEESIERQATWVVNGKNQYNTDLRKERARTKDFVKKFFKAAQVSYKFFLVQFEMAKIMVNQDVQAQREQRFGLLNANIMTTLRQKMNEIGEELSKGNYQYVLQGMELHDNIRDYHAMEGLLAYSFGQGFRKYGNTNIYYDDIYDKFVHRSLPFSGKIRPHNSSIPIIFSTDSHKELQNLDSNLYYTWRDLKPQTNTCGSFEYYYQMIEKQREEARQTEALDILIRVILESFPLANYKQYDGLVELSMQYIATYLNFSSIKVNMFQNKYNYLQDALSADISVLDSNRMIELSVSLAMCLPFIKDKTKIVIRFWNVFTQVHFSTSKQLVTTLQESKEKYQMVYEKGSKSIKMILMIKSLANYVLRKDFLNEFKSNCGLVENTDVKDLSDKFVKILNLNFISSKMILKTFNIESSELTEFDFEEQITSVRYRESNFVVKKEEPNLKKDQNEQILKENQKINESLGVQQRKKMESQGIFIKVKPNKKKRKKMSKEEEVEECNH